VRIKSPETVQRELRFALNGYAAQIAEKVLAKALAGDTQALNTASNLLLAANSRTQEKAK
jgi:hypothetical protein